MNSCCQTTSVANRNAVENTSDTASRSTRSFSPAVDIVETADRFTLTADVPGADAGGVEAHFEEGVLKVRGTVQPRQSNDTRWLVREYGVGTWERSFRIGEGIDVSRIEARCTGGVLTLTLPKAEHVLPRKIEVRGN